MVLLGTVFSPQRFCTFEAFHERKLENSPPRFMPCFSLQASKSQLLLDAMAFLRKALRTAMFYQHIEMRKALTPLARFYLQEKIIHLIAFGLPCAYQCLRMLFIEEGKGCIMQICC